MASLRKRLGNAGVDLSNPKLNESFVLIGTPLPPLETLKDKNEFVPLWKQEVRDEQGRRRLHGAFTGGFSAGYFNTVGSKEGWTPSTFKSSRNDRSSKKVMRPEDFMDEEDLSEMREDSKLVDRDEVGEMQPRANEDVSFAAALASMLPPINESVGAQLLKRMGWKPGQGIGPRLTYEQMKRRNERDGITTTVLESAEAVKHTYAPQDRKLPSVTRKDGSHGLGYTGAAGLRSTLDPGAASSGPRLSAGFGLGALNDADDDDVDIYDDKKTRNSRHLAYDPLEAEADSRRAKQSQSQRSQTKGQTAGFFKNGIPLLRGFMITDTAVTQPQRFDSVQVPADWKPDPTRVWDSGQRSEQHPVQRAGGPISQQQQQQQQQKGTSADERGVILGETPLPATKRSIWDYISQKDRERLQNNKTNPEAQKAREVESTPVVTINVPRTDAAIAKAALMGYQPFKNDPLKQARYTAYLNSQASSQSMPLQPLNGQTITSFNSELESFAKAAQIFKPMSTAMASRFRSSSSIEAAPKQQEGLYQPTEETYAQHEEKSQETQKKMEVEETPKENAARMGLFGRLTREESDWAPARLLCKRFKVSPPKISTTETAGNVSDPASSAYQVDPSSFETPMELDPNPGTGNASFTVVATEENGGNDRKKDIANIGLGEDDSQGQDILTYQRPEMDIFKAIFASDDEDGDSNADPDEVVPPSSQLQPTANTSGGETATGSAGPASSGPVDLATFRPTFTSRTNREGKKNDSTAESLQKSSSKKTKARPSLSFVDDEAGLTVIPATKKRKKEKDSDGKSSKKKKDKEVKSLAMETPKISMDDEDDEMWVEKEVPSAVLNLPQQASASNPPAEDPSRASGRARPRASDFL